MTMRRFMWIFAGIALGSFALAAAGHWWLQWPPGPVRTWLGIGTGYLVAALAFTVMPRWWREHCDESYALPAGKRYVRTLLVLMGSYSVLLFLSVSLIRRGVDPAPLKALVALLPVVPLVLLLFVALRYLREIDELQRRIETDSIGIASLLVSLIYFAGGLLQLAKLIDVNAGAAMIWVFPLIMLFYGAAKFFAVRRYR